METNEIEKNTITAQNAENAQLNSNNQPSAEKADEINTEKVTQTTTSIDVQATQRIELLSELLKDTENTQKENTAAKISEDLKQKYLAGKITEEKEQNNEKSAPQVVENGVELKEENTAIAESTQDKSQQHNQDKKDYRLEKLLLDRINAMQGKIKESLELIKKFERINAKEENLPNIVTTLRDKLTLEVIKQFRTVGIEFNMKSYLVQAIVADLLGIFEDGISEFKECSENLNFVREVQEDFESRVELAPTSKVKNMFARLRGLFRPERKQERLIDLERARQEKKLEEANIHLIKYKYKNSELDKYTIRKNIVNSLTREMLTGKSSGLTLTVQEFIAKKITPEIEQLGLQYLCESLEDSLYKGYKEKCEVASKEEFMAMSMGDVRKSIKMSAYDVARSKIVMTTGGKDIEAEEDRMVI